MTRIRHRLIIILGLLLILRHKPILQLGVMAIAIVTTIVVVIIVLGTRCTITALSTLFFLAHALEDVHNIEATFI